MREIKETVPELLKVEFVKSVGDLSFELRSKDLFDNPKSYLMGENRTLSFIPRHDESPVVLVCEFNQQPELAVYARFALARNGTSLDIVDAEQKYICPHMLGRTMLVQHTDLAITTTEFLRSQG
jgi:hypothetical protein